MVERNPYPTRDFSDRDLVISSFLLRHRELFKRMGTGSLILLDAVFVGLFFYNIYRYAITYEETEQAVVASGTLEIDWVNIRAVTAPDPLVASTISVLPAGEQTDFVAKITNTNDKRWGLFEYRFVYPGGASEWAESFVLPEDEKYVMALGNPGSGISSVQLETRNVSWKPLSQVLRERYDVTRDAITVVASRFIPNVNEELTGVPNSGVEFTVTNNSPFDFQNISFSILVTNGIEVTAVNRASIATLRRGIDRVVRTRWFRVVGGGQVVIEPDINYLDDTVYADREDPSDENF